MPRIRLRKQPDARGAQAMVALRAGANDDDARLYAGIGEDEWALWLEGDFGDEVAKAKAELAVYAAGVVRTVVGNDVTVAQRIVDRAHAEHELERLHRVSRVSET